MSSMFGQTSTFFGQPSTDLQQNIAYMQNAQAVAALDPLNAQAQRQAAYWQEIVARQAAAHGVPGYAGAPQGSLPTQPQAAPTVQPLQPPMFGGAAPAAPIPQSPASAFTGSIGQAGFH